MNVSDLLQSFVPSKARPLAPRPYLVPSIYLTCTLGSFLPPGVIRSGSVAVTISYLIAQIPKATIGDVASDVLTPIQAVLVLLHWLDFYVLHDPTEYSRKGKKIDQTKGWWEKFKWYLDLNTAMRGVGWDWEVKNIPKAAPPGTTKWQFVRARMGEAAIWYLLLDLAASIIRYSIYGSAFPPDLAQDTLPRQLLFTWLPGALSCWGNLLQYSVFSALAVAAGLFRPQDWPPLFGKLRDVYSVRDLWGKFWHQLLRRKLNIPFQVLTRVFPVKKGTLLSRYGQLYLAFATSAIIHAIGALNVPGSDTVDIMWPQLNYFLIQPIAITCEDIAMHLGRKWGVQSSWKTRLLGRVWTFAWFSWSLRLTASHHYRLGVFATKHVPSLTDLVWQK